MTNIHVVIDRSGSMAAIKTDAIGGFNEFVKSMRGKENQRWYVWLFDTGGIDLILDGVRDGDVKELTEETYIPRGGTPLYDAVGKAMAKAREVAAERNVFVVLTDGEENSSKEWSKAAVTKELDAVKDDDWQLVFIAAGKEAWSEDMFADRGMIVQAGGTGLAMAGSYAAMTRIVGGYTAGADAVQVSLTVDDDGKVSGDGSGG